MNRFQKRTATRIATVSILLAALVSPVAWFVTRAKAEQSIVSLASEASGRLLRQHDAINLSDPQAVERATLATQAITAGMFDVAEIYDRKGQKLATSLAREGQEVLPLLPLHETPSYTTAHFESVRVPGERWMLRVFVPLRASADDGRSPITGYFEGVRVVPEWQKADIRANALTMALIACLASLLCGAALYPVMRHLSKSNERKTYEVMDSHLSLMGALGRAIAERDSDTGAHNYRVAWIASLIGDQMGFAGATMQSLIAGSFLHDVGKIGITDAILLKPGQLSEAELAIMHTHVTLGEHIVNGIGWLKDAKMVVAAHHERWDGTGYPRQLAGAAIPLSARIFSVADVFDALCSRRPYKEPMGFETTMTILEKGTGSHFDPAVMDVFRPMAHSIFEQLQGISEPEARQLLEDRVRHHFER